MSAKNSIVKPPGNNPQASGVQPRTTAKPSKPYPAFPLTPHPAGYWCKKIRGKVHYFGHWADPDGALDKYLKQKDALHAGKLPREETDGVLTVNQLANAFLIHKQALVDAGELGQRSWDEYKSVAVLLIKHFGKHRLVDDLGPDDFARLRMLMSEKWGPVRLGNVMQRIRSVFKFGVEDGLIANPIPMGRFKGPSKKVLRLHRAKQGPKLFTADEIRRMIAASDVQLKAMLLLGINAGFTMADCGTLPLSALDLDTGFLDFPRAKTGIDRRCPLWPETIAAIKAWLDVRPLEAKEKEDNDLVFLTYQRRSWHKPEGSSPAVFKTKKLLTKLGINGRKGLGFATLRHVFQTVGDEARDFVAVRKIMGHVGSADVSDHYRERIDDSRLRAVADHVHDWLFPAEHKEGASND